MGAQSKFDGLTCSHQYQWCHVALLSFCSLQFLVTKSLSFLFVDVLTIRLTAKTAATGSSTEENPNLIHLNPQLTKPTDPTSTSPTDPATSRDSSPSIPSPSPKICKSPARNLPRFKTQGDWELGT